LSHIQHYYLQQRVLFKIIVTSYTYIIKFTKCLFAVILQWIHTHTRSVDDKITAWISLLACTGWRRECRTVRQSYILTKYIDICMHTFH